MQSIPISNASWGLALGIPFSFGLAAIASTIRWKGAKYVLPEEKVKTPNAPGQDEDEVENALYANEAAKVEEEKKKKAERRKALRNMLCTYAVIGGASYGLQFLPGWGQDLYMVILISLPAALLGSVTLCDITGLSECRMARTSEGVLRSWDEYSNWGAAFFAPFLIAGVACIAYIDNIPTYIQIPMYTFFAATLPFRLGVLFNGTPKDSMALKWVLFGYTTLITVACAIVAVIGGIIYVVMEYGLWTKIFGESKPSEPKPEKSHMSESLVANIMPLQVSIMIAMVAVVTSQLYRIDFALAQRKAHGGAVRLETLTDEAEESLYVRDSKVQADEHKKDNKVKVTSWMVLPSYGSLIRSGKMKHFLVRPRYSLVGVVTVQGLLLGFPTVVNSFVGFFHRHDVAWAQTPKQLKDLSESLPMFAVFLAPFALTLTVGIASLISGEARFVFNYQANWKVPVSNAQREAVEGESEPLFTDEKDATNEEK